MSVVAVAVDGTVTVNPQPKLLYDTVADPVYGVVLDFHDGRKAAFFEAIGNPIQVPLSLDQTENTCDPDLKLVKCKLGISLAAYSGWVKWIAHPDPAKVGAVLHAKFTTKHDGGMPTIEEVDLKDETIPVLTGYYAHFFPKYDKMNFLLDNIRCDNFDWTKKMVKTGTQVHVDEITSENMDMTEETGLNENQTDAGVYDVTFNQKDAHTLEFFHMGSTYPIHFFLPPYLSNSVLNMTYTSVNGNICQVAFQTSSDMAAAAVNDPNFRKMDMSTYGPIKESSAIFSLLNNVIYKIPQLKTSDGNYQAEVN